MSRAFSTVGGKLPKGWGDLVRQIAILVSVDLAYTFVRGIVDSERALAFTHGQQVIDLERSLGTFFEPSLQAFFLPAQWVIDAANQIYLNAQFSIALGFLLWLYLFRNQSYYFVRNMEAMRQQWTDVRLDDLNGKVDRGFDRNDSEIRALRIETKSEFTAVREEMRSEFAAVREEMRSEFAAVRTEMRTEFAAVRSEMKAGFERVDERFDRIDERFERIDERFESLHRLLVQFCAVILAALIGLIASLAGVVVTQL